MLAAASAAKALAPALPTGLPRRLSTTTPQPKGRKQPALRPWAPGSIPFRADSDDLRPVLRKKERGLSAMGICHANSPPVPPSSVVFSCLAEATRLCESQQAISSGPLRVPQQRVAETGNPVKQIGTHDGWHFFFRGPPAQKDYEKMTDYGKMTGS